MNQDVEQTLAKYNAVWRSHYFGKVGRVEDPEVLLGELVKAGCVLHGTTLQLAELKPQYDSVRPLFALELRAENFKYPIEVM